MHILVVRLLGVGLSARGRGLGALALQHPHCGHSTRLTHPSIRGIVFPDAHSQPAARGISVLQRRSPGAFGKWHRLRFGSTVFGGAQFQVAETSSVEVASAGGTSGQLRTFSHVTKTVNVVPSGEVWV